MEKWGSERGSDKQSLINSVDLDHKLEFLFQIHLSLYSRFNSQSNIRLEMKGSSRETTVLLHLIFILMCS